MSATFHSLKREYAGGDTIEGSITPTCSCGWKGRAEYAWNDWQHTNVADQEKEHLSTLTHPPHPEGINLP